MNNDKNLRWLRRAALIPSLLVALLAKASGAVDPGYRLFIGTYTGNGSDGIYACRFDPVTGVLGPAALVAATDNPSFLAIAPGGGFLYAVNELDTFRHEATGAVSVFAVDRKTAALTLLQQVPSLGGSPAHLSLDQTGRFLMVANYNGGNFAVFPIGHDGRLGPHSAFVQDVGSGVNPERQAGPHVHSIQVTADNRFALVADLGLDKLLIYRFDARAGSLTPGNPEFVKVEPGAGPRHVAFAPSGKFVYVLNEMASTIVVFAYHPNPGTLQAKQTLSALPKDFTGKNTAAEILVDAKGATLYASNRGEDSIAVFRINPDNGTLTLVERVPCGGKTPRSFALDPSGRWLLVANQDSNDIRLFRIDPGSGRLSPESGSLKIVAPVCLRFWPLE